MWTGTYRSTACATSATSAAVRRRTGGASTPAARTLSAQAESRIATTGRLHARLDCLAANPRLRRYYESAGYRAVGGQPRKKGGLGSPYAVTLPEERLQ